MTFLLETVAFLAGRQVNEMGRPGMCGGVGGWGGGGCGEGIRGEGEKGEPLLGGSRSPALNWGGKKTLTRAVYS